MSSPEAVELAIPLRPESTAVTQFLASLPEARTLRIVVLPGRREDLHPLRHDDRIAVVDVVDLLRIAQSRAAERSQQGGPVATEVFRGRGKNLESLRATRGPTILFSGRMMGKSSILAKIDADIANRNEGGSSEICVRISSAGEDPLPSLVEAMAKILGSAGRQFVQEETRLRAKIIRGRGRKAAPKRASKIANWRLESEEGGVCQRPMS